MVGCFLFIHRDDLKALAPAWLSYTADVREDPEVGDGGGGVQRAAKTS